MATSLSVGTCSRAVVITAALVLAAAASASAQTSADRRWNDWVGCWDLLADGSTTRLPPPEEAAQGAGPIQPGGPRDARVCVVPGQGGVELRTLVANHQVLTQTIVADGMDHPITDTGCTGTQRAQWSADGLRLFSRAQVTCSAQAPRTVTGLALIAPDGQWVDVQAVTIDGRDSVRVRRFRPTAERVLAGVPAAAVRLQVAHVKEASTLVSPRVIEAALIETGARFPLSSRVLVDLDKAGVPDSVIDLMVALSYPRSFAIRPTEPADRLTPFPPLFPGAGGDFVDASLDYPYYYSPYYLGYAGYFYSPYYFSPFGYSYLRYYPQFGFPTAIIVPGDGGGGGSAGKGSLPENGKAINGLGYTRVYPRDRDGTASDGSSTPRSSAASRGTVSPRGYTAGGDASSGASSSSSGGSSGGSSSSSSGGASSGSSDGGRTAVPR